MCGAGMLLQERKPEMQKKGLQEPGTIPKRSKEVRSGTGRMLQHAKPEFLVERKKIDPGIESGTADGETLAEGRKGSTAEEVRSEDGKDKEKAVGSMGDQTCR